MTKGGLLGALDEGDAFFVGERLEGACSRLGLAGSEGEAGAGAGAVVGADWEQSEPMPLMGGSGCSERGIVVHYFRLSERPSVPLTSGAVIINGLAFCSR